MPPSRRAHHSAISLAALLLVSLVHAAPVAYSQYEQYAACGTGTLANDAFHAFIYPVGVCTLDGSLSFKNTCNATQVRELKYSDDHCGAQEFDLPLLNVGCTQYAISNHIVGCENTMPSYNSSYFQRVIYDDAACDPSSTIIRIEYQQKDRCGPANYQQMAPYIGYNYFKSVEGGVDLLCCTNANCTDCTFYAEYTNGTCSSLGASQSSMFWSNADGTQGTATTATGPNPGTTMMPTTTAGASTGALSSSTTAPANATSTTNGVASAAPLVAVIVSVAVAVFTAM